MRLLALEYGADMVYTPELIAHKLARCVRVENERLGCVDFMDDDSLVLRIAPAERHAVVLQIGAADKDLALRAARLCEADINAVDLNMGCPKPFSVKGGMGAALLKTPEKAVEILTTLVSSLSIPVTCKIRLLEDDESTIALVKQLAATGVSAIGVHGRTRDMRPREPALWARIKAVADAVDVPIIANGDCFKFEDFATMTAATGAASIMVARGAQWNVSLFSPDGMVPPAEVAARYTRLALHWGMAPGNAKFTLNAMTTFGMGPAIQAAKTWADLASMFKLENEYELLCTASGSEHANWVPSSRTRAKMERIKRSRAEKARNTAKKRSATDAASKRPAADAAAGAGPAKKAKRLDATASA
ncbi:uncharacterized protein AMSG_10549 [Thecamonas trahens ATCC 50062]|uniref:DUS-like FMN-binding domain-containing protein n=1 Tax=Thecamonas trahens ATCC 50062 TaxID=461836 RepID=A0A0L0DRE3_THETB|nr:hypothetical protein AMSG_10549 [Thecamonas trahens ATCC 50062]KNC54894.1 hypothetical protein AMSG_10549 [Thecamonas trahens ATCC 50062]|eukprot:XP_013753485.1 hypothetical protein AMSG_10549 [Thecamonas trahens ATCC 50062]